MYVASDPRAKLAPAAETRAAARIAPAHFYRLDDPEKSETDGKARHWYARAQSFVAVHTRAGTGAELPREGQPDEYMVILHDPEARVRIEWQGTAIEIAGNSLAFVPAGDSRITALTDATIIRFFTTRARDLLARAMALNPGYEVDGNVPPLEPWPEPPTGPAVRVYSLDIPKREGRFGRIFRCTTFMVNFTDPRHGPRDRSKLSPHQHDDFQQCSLCLAGTYVHHLRWPWETDADTWRDDVHETCGAPSIAIIPARALHTSEAVGAGTNILVDVFCPPRIDFSRQEGWVLNADDYPMPA